MRELTTHSPLGIAVAVALLTCLGAAHGRICDKHQFWSAFHNECLNCTRCVHPDIVITPCQGHRDTACGPLSDLKIDWSWMRRADHNKHRAKEMTETFKENMQEIKLHEMHVKEKERMLRRLQKHKQASPESDTDEDQSVFTAKQDLWNRLKALGREKELENKKITEEIINSLPKAQILREHPKIFQIPHDQLLQSLHFDSEEAKELLNSSSGDNEDDEDDDEEPTEGPVFPNEKLVKNFGFFPVTDDGKNDLDDYEGVKESPDVSEKELAFSTTERMVLDYQAAVLYVALASIVVFFLVALCYSLKHLRTWSTYNYREDLEELKNWIYTQSHKAEAKPLTSTIYKSTTEVVSNPGPNNCKYLERIITKNAKRKLNRVPQNVYQGAHPGIETRPLTASNDDLEVHKPTCV